MFQDHYNKRRDVRARPEVWIPILLDFYKVAERIVRGFSVDVAVAGAGAYTVHMDLDSTKDIDLVLLHPLSVGDLAEILERVAENASFSEAELFEILARLGLREIVKSNARDLLERTGSRRLHELLTLLI